MLLCINNILTLHVCSSSCVTTIQSFDSLTQTLVSQTRKTDLETLHLKVWHGKMIGNQEKTNNRIK
jgi:hypothetical protein